MHYHNQPLTPSTPVPIPWVRSDGLELVLHLKPLPLGFQRRLAANGVVPPIPPARLIRDSRGRPVRDEQDRPLTTPDEHDAHFQHDLALYHQRVAVLMLVEGLRDDPAIRWDTTIPADGTGDWNAAADQLLAELAASGWTDTDLVSLCEQIAHCGRTVGERARAAEGNCSAPAAPA